jgi:hypothetical protein
MSNLDHDALALHTDALAWTAGRLAAAPPS